MNLLNILQIISALGTIAIGVVSLFWPLKVRGFTGLEPRGGPWITEIRSILGAFFIGLGATAIYFNIPETYQMLGITYLLVGVVRGVSMFVDDSVENSNTISVISEIILGVILVL